MSTLWIIRGIPGSGKTTFAKKLMGMDVVDRHFEADQYFEAANGEYTFVREKLGQAHEACRENARIHLEAGLDVAVSNTSTMWKEILDYIKIANGTQSDVAVVEMTSNYGSIHGVPEDVLGAMRRRFLSKEKFREMHKQYFGTDYQGLYLEVA